MKDREFRRVNGLANAIAPPHGAGTSVDIEVSKPLPPGWDDGPRVEVNMLSVAVVVQPERPLPIGRLQQRALGSAGELG